MINRKVIAIVGPTGSGKTEAAVTVAKKFNGVIISADSRQVYRRLDIGTNKLGKPGYWLGESCRLIEDIPQLMVDIVNAGEKYDLNQWLEESARLLNKIFDQSKLPIICGGTGLYASALIEGYRPGGGRNSKTKIKPEFDTLVLIASKDRDQIYRKSDARIDQLFDSLSQEVRSLLAQGVSLDWLIKIGLDYRYAAAFIDGKSSKDESILELQRASRQYIGRQLTWWRHHSNPQLYQTTGEALRKIEKFLKEKQK